MTETTNPFQPLTLGDLELPNRMSWHHPDPGAGRSARRCAQRDERHLLRPTREYGADHQ